MSPKSKNRLVVQPEKLRLNEPEKPIVFSFKYLHPTSFTKSRNANRKFFSSFLLRLQKLSELGWKQILTDKRHGFGREKIPLSEIKPRLNYSPSPEQTFLLSLRATGDNHVFLGVRQDNIFYILFIEAEFGDIYDHN